MTGRAVNAESIATAGSGEERYGLRGTGHLDSSEPRAVWSMLGSKDELLSVRSRFEVTCSVLCARAEDPRVTQWGHCKTPNLELPLAVHEHCTTYMYMYLCMYVPI